MQSAVAPLTAARTVFHSADHVSMFAAYLPIDDLLTATTLCRASHSLFNSNAVWQSRLKDVQCTQRVCGVYDMVVPRQLCLLDAQLAAMPPLPPLADVAALCLQHYVQSVKPRGLVPPSLCPEHFSPSLRAIIQVPSTLCYHARIVSYDKQRVQHRLELVQFTLAYSEAQHAWRVADAGDRHSGFWAANIDDNCYAGAVEDKKEGRAQQPHSLVVPARTVGVGSCRRRYFELAACSEHRRSHRSLLPPSFSSQPRTSSASVSWTSPAAPSPLCCACRTVIARSLGYAQSGSVEYYRRFRCHTHGHSLTVP